MYASLKKSPEVLPDPTGQMIQLLNNSPFKWCLMNDLTVGGGV